MLLDIRVLISKKKRRWTVKIQLSNLFCIIIVYKYHLNAFIQWVKFIIVRCLWCQSLIWFSSLNTTSLKFNLSLIGFWATECQNQQIEVVHSLNKLYESWKLAFYVFVWIELFSCLFSVLNVHSHYICFIRVLHFIILYMIWVIVISE
jgi:hypothetical protein